MPRHARYAKNAIHKVLLLAGKHSKMRKNVAVAAIMLKSMKRVDVVPIKRPSKRKAVKLATGTAHA